MQTVHQSADREGGVERPRRYQSLTLSALSVRRRSSQILQTVAEGGPFGEGERLSTAHGVDAGALQGGHHVRLGARQAGAQAVE